MHVLFALLAAATGLLLVFGGYRFARIIIPLWGFVAGLSLGGAVIGDMASTPFLGTALGITVGLFAGIVFAVLAYLFYAAAIIVLAGSLGYWAGSSFIMWLGLNHGLISTLVGAALGIAVGLAALFLDAPKYVLIALTAISGAVLTVGGVMLLFNKIPLDTFSYTSARLTIANSALWSFVALALAILGILVQARTTTAYDFETWSTGSHHHYPPATHTPYAPH